MHDHSSGLLTQPWLLAATDTRGDWHFGIGDPTPIGWFTVFAYLVATLACGVVWTRERQAQAWRGGQLDFLAGADSRLAVPGDQQAA